MRDMLYGKAKDGQGKAKDGQGKVPIPPSSAIHVFLTCVKVGEGIMQF